MTSASTYDPAWPDSQRLRVVCVIVARIQTDLLGGRYSEPGRPNCQSALLVATEPAHILDLAMVGAPDFVRVAAGLAGGRRL